MNVPTFSRRRYLLSTIAAGGAAATSLRHWPGPAAFARDAGQAAGDFDDLVAELDELIRQRMEEDQIPGVAIGLLVGDQEHIAGFGVTNVDHPLPVDGETLFQIGSTTKTFTGTAMMRLVEQGKVDLDAPVRAYLPDFAVADPEVSANVTVLQLLTHNAGWFGDDFTDTGDGDDALERYVAEMSDLAQIAPLGQYFSYNNAAVSVAGRVIEAVTGNTYETAIARLVLAPLQLEQTYFFPEQIMTEAFAVGHNAPGTEAAVLTPWALPRSVNPAGGLVSSITDQLRYARFHLGDGTLDGRQLLSAESLRWMQTPHGPGGALIADRLEGIGVTWLLMRRGATRIVMHGGSTIGQQSAFVLVPDQHAALVVHTNATAGAALGQEIIEWTAKRVWDSPRPPTPLVAIAPSELAEYGGEYALPDGSAVVIRAEDDTLVIASQVGGLPLPLGSLTLRYLGDDRFVTRLEGLPVMVDFERDDRGQIGWFRVGGRMVPRTT